MRFTGGWVKMWRKLLDPEWMSCFDGYSRALLLDFVLMANIKEGRSIFREGKVLYLKRGEILTSETELARSTGFSRSVIRRRIKLLEETGTILSKRDKHGTMITICNYDKYQMNDLREGLRANGWTTNDLQHNDNTQTINGLCSKEEKELKKTKKKRKEELNTLSCPESYDSPPSVEGVELVIGEIVSEGPLPPPFGVPSLEIKQINPKKQRMTKPKLNPTDACLGIAKEWLEYAVSELPWLAKNPKWTIECFAEDLERVKRATDLNDEGLQKILSYVRKDQFWRDKACSPSGLLTKNKNGLRKVDNIIPRLRTKFDRELEILKELEDNPMTEEDLWK